MNAERIIIGQNVHPIKKQRAREFRREMTPEEKILWHYLRGNRLGFKFRRQQVIDGFIIDYYCHAAGVILEIDGGIHQMQKEYDAERDRIVQSLGLQVLRIMNEEIYNDLYRVVARIKEICIRQTESHK